MARRTDQQTVSSEFASVPVVRQPIVDREKDLFAYDLRFPADAEVISVDGDPEQAWAWLSGGGGDASDLLALAGDTKAFLQITPALLMSAAYAALPGGSAIVELTGATNLTNELLAGCRKLKAAGFQLALNGAGYGPGFGPLLELADLLCFDFFTARKVKHCFNQGRFDKLNVALHARKLISHADFDEAVKMGFTYFEGAFLSKPEITAGVRIPANKLAYLRFIELVNRS